MPTERRSLLKRLLGLPAALAGLTETEAALPETRQDVPLYQGHTRLGNLIFISGAGAHFEGDIRSHTDHVLKEIEKELIKAGSSMQKVLKVSVLLHDLSDYQAMNEVYRGRFGNKPPVRTTVAVRAGVPNDSLVEIDCIAYI
ncbi:RidA family protein [Larkinella soli]|uniref:RidA family protein n=1 Tax=Larkinella soli TaxID=1770527 RepID=UPI000FFBCFE9|nr:RidA family protein [Larkinella soli]